MEKTITALNSLLNTCNEIKSNGASRFDILIDKSDIVDFSTPDLAPESIKILDFYLREVVLKNLIEEGKKTTQK